MAAKPRGHRAMPHLAIVSRHDEASKRRKLNVASDVPYSNGQPGAFEFRKELLANPIIYALLIKPVFLKLFFIAQLPQGRGVAPDDLTNSMTNSLHQMIP